MFRLGSREMVLRYGLPRAVFTALGIDINRRQGDVVGCFSFSDLRAYTISFFMLAEFKGVSRRLKNVEFKPSFYKV